MINFHLRSKSFLLFPQLKVLTLRQGLEACEFCASIFCKSYGWSVTLTPTDRRKAFPSVHFQCEEEGMFLQFFADANLAESDIEGWFTMSRLESGNEVVKPVILLESESDECDYFDAIFADGVGISKGYLCNKDMVIGALRKMKSSEVKDWFAHANWHNLGLI